MPVASPIPFAPTARVLEAVLDELDDLEGSGGGIVPLATRRAALNAYAALVKAERDTPPRWRHRLSEMRFDDLLWTSGRIPGPRGSGTAAGLVHAGSVYLQAPVAPVGGARLMTLADAARVAPKELAKTWRQLVPADADAFAALSVAFQNCGAYVDVAAGARLDSPLQLVWTAQPAYASAVFPHVVIRVGKGARATIVERHLGESDSFNAGIVEVDLEAGAELDYVVVSQIDGGARTAMRRAARCASGATMRWHVADLGGALARSHLRCELAERARGDANVLFFARDFEHVDAIVDVEQTGPSSESRTVVRAAASGLGQIRFGGTVGARRGATHARATYRQDALVLSRDAYVDGRPVLDVEAHDVFVAHAASIGGLDEDELFYVQTRGIARGAAERMVALAFFEPAIVNFPTEALRDEVRTALDEELDTVGETFAS